MTWFMSHFMSNKISQNVYWYSLKDPNPSESLLGEMKTKIAVIGGGMAGLSCAQKLQQTGHQVVMIGKKFCGA